jgi:hypothetical protein
MADAPRHRSPADAWRVPLEGHVRRYVDLWVRSLDDGQLRLAHEHIEEILEVCGLLLNPEPAAEQDQEQEKAS